eukprot:4364039-Alexandrium_andersonii.AAC.1
MESTALPEGMRCWLRRSSIFRPLPNAIARAGTTSRTRDSFRHHPEAPEVFFVHQVSGGADVRRGFVRGFAVRAHALAAPPPEPMR